MKNESIILSKEPKLLVILSDFNFQIIEENKAPKFYTYSDIKKIELKKGKTNWIITFFDFIITLIFTNTSGKIIHKNKNELTLSFEEESITYRLSKEYEESANQVIDYLNQYTN